jgi:hypothetical protein
VGFTYSSSPAGASAPPAGFTHIPVVCTEDISVPEHMAGSQSSHPQARTVKLGALRTYEVSADRLGHSRISSRGVRPGPRATENARTQPPPTPHIHTFPHTAAH